MNQQNKRNIQRFSFTFNVYNENGNLLGVTKNISPDGFFLETEKNITKDTLSIAIELPGAVGRVNMDCTVVRNEDTGIGTKLSLDDENRKNFTRIIENLNEFKE